MPPRLADRTAAAVGESPAPETVLGRGVGKIPGQQPRNHDRHRDGIGQLDHGRIAFGEGDGPRIPPNGASPKPDIARLGNGSLVQSRWPRDLVVTIGTPTGDRRRPQVGQVDRDGGPRPRLKEVGRVSPAVLAVDERIGRRSGRSGRRQQRHAEAAGHLPCCPARDVRPAGSGRHTPPAGPPRASRSTGMALVGKHGRADGSALLIEVPRVAAIRQPEQAGPPGSGPDRIANRVIAEIHRSGVSPKSTGQNPGPRSCRPSLTASAP